MLELTEQHIDSGLAPLLEKIRQQHGDALQAILVYGSWLRGKRDTMLDFYVLVKDYNSLDSVWQRWMCQLLPPNVYHIHLQAGGGEQRAKYALMTLQRFCHAVQHDFHSYFWARFAQPCEVLYVSDAATQENLHHAFKAAARTFVRHVLPTMPGRFESRELWTRGLSLTYRCELRTESSNRAETLYEFNPEYYDQITHSLAHSSAAISVSTQTGLFCNQHSNTARKLSSFSWWLRRMQGKLLSILRLLKAAFTFNDALQYLLWKIERHSGVYIQPSKRQLKHPLIFAWPLLWRLYRQGAFR